MLALHRLAQCPREQHSQLKVSAPFTQLLALLEKQAFTLTPKVCMSSLCKHSCPQKIRQIVKGASQRLLFRKGGGVDPSCLCYLSMTLRSYDGKMSRILASLS